MKFGITFLFLIFLAISVQADELIVPRSCYPKEVQAKFVEKGYNLDLSAMDRTEESWGFLMSKGTEYSIFTYRNLEAGELEKIMKILGEL